MAHDNNRGNVFWIDVIGQFDLKRPKCICRGIGQHLRINAFFSTAAGNRINQPLAPRLPLLKKAGCKIAAGNGHIAVKRIEQRDNLLIAKTGYKRRQP